MLKGKALPKLLQLSMLWWCSFVSAFEAGSWILEFDDNETCTVDSEDLQEVYSWCSVLSILRPASFVSMCSHRERAGDRPSQSLCTAGVEWSGTISA